MTPKKLKAVLVALACAGVPLITTATCDPFTGTFGIFRDDDHDYYYEYDFYYEEVVYYDDYYYDDCWLFDCWW